jgi:hypothetical protein
VEKKDAKKLRPCQDYRYLNEFTKPNAYPLPLISDLMIMLKGSKFFTKLDIRWGYNNVRIKEGDEWKAAFITNKGLFELTVMFFGLRNSPATFQAMMDDYFRDMIDEGWIAIYMDDILIHAKTKEDLEKRTKWVLERLKEHDLYLKPEKCKFERTEVEFLGTIISENTIRMDPIKLAGIRDWPSPTTVKQTRSFLGFGNYYRRFISGFAEIARPLHELTKKDKIWNWTNECQTAFETLKERALPTQQSAFTASQQPQRPWPLPPRPTPPTPSRRLTPGTASSASTRKSRTSSTTSRISASLPPHPYRPVPAQRSSKKGKQSSSSSVRNDDRSGSSRASSTWSTPTTMNSSSGMKTHWSHKTKTGEPLHGDPSRNGKNNHRRRLKSPKSNHHSKTGSSAPHNNHPHHYNPRANETDYDDYETPEIGDIHGDEVYNNID